MFFHTVFPRHVVSYVYLDLNEKRRLEKIGRGGGCHKLLAGCTQEGGGSFRCVQSATSWVGGLEIRRKCVCNI